MATENIYSLQQPRYRTISKNVIGDNGSIQIRTTPTAWTDSFLEATVWKDLQQTTTWTDSYEEVKGWTGSLQRSYASVDNRR